MSHQPQGVLETDGIVDPLIRRVHDVLRTFDRDSVQSILDLTDALNKCSVLLAKDQTLKSSRHVVGETNPSLRKLVQELWKTSAELHADEDIISTTQLATLSQSLAKFTRNLVAAEPHNQQRVLSNEPTIRAMAYRYTSYAALQEPASIASSRMLVQALSNLVTGNEPLLQNIWKMYLSLPEEQLILLRLFASPDMRTASSTFIFILNCIHGNRERLEMLIRSPRGPRLCICVLDRINSLVDAEEATDGAHAFDVGYEVFSLMAEGGLIPALYTTIALEDEIVTPHQTTLLKLLDSHLQRPGSNSPLNATDQLVRNDLLRMLTDEFFALSAYVQRTIRKAMGPKVDTDGDKDAGCGGEAAAPKPPQELDLLLPKVCEALVLVTQCLISLALHAEELAGAPVGSSADRAQSEQAMSYTGRVKNHLTQERSTGGEGLPESIVEILRLIDVFVPRITFGKVVQRPLPPGATAQDTAAEAHPSAAAGFSYVKRDLVRLLGILCSENRDVQDRVREAGGIPVVMNLCVIDDQNPYLKEHAIFTLRNILHGNKENQDVVKEIQPVGRWDEYGVLQSI
ncbi:uncharacterized protein LAESUDRAFT_664148 [Laetiporus sulphureus 93-53]|uniref:Ataxin-10 homolog n=1 Tax=Laetiporus sulphureus 93-53 TaxID=1314785 RepID=A0A165BMR8_9APHY|nr:uncharacterized protein LAESUDRAFT_664148 [Laetiporus sulphureus 93-53]KZT01323.1 hypothetical protein LAESUDRAFT_664148 [Laetiporus sulphureus 93-53]